jgi:O-antigen ligase
VAALRQIELWRQSSRSFAFALFLATVALSFVRARDQPSVDVTLGGTTASLVPADVALVALAVVSLAVLRRERIALGARAVVVTAAVFCALVLGTAAANGSTALVAAGKLVELAALGFGALVLVRTRGRLEALVDLLILFTAVADVYALVEFVRAGGGRQASFLGEHDFAALATMPLVYGLVLVFEGRAGRRAAAAIAAGSVGVALGAALASLVGLYIGAAVLLALLIARRACRLRPVLVTIAIVGSVTAATLLLRSGDLGFLQEWFGKEESRPGQYAASWSQRLIYAYVGYRVFLDHPVLGTGWWGELPPHVFAGHLPEARRRFPDQPAPYFPPANRNFIPQQAYDQVLYELGVVGAASLAAFAASLIARCVAAARRWRDRLAYLPAVWLAAAAGAIAGEGLFGGSALPAVVWLTAGLVAVIPLIVDRCESSTRSPA